MYIKGNTCKIILAFYLLAFVKLIYAAPLTEKTLILLNNQLSKIEESTESSTALSRLSSHELYEESANSRKSSRFLLSKRERNV